MDVGERKAYEEGRIEGRIEADHEYAAQERNRNYQINSKLDKLDPRVMRGASTGGESPGPGLPVGVDLSRQGVSRLPAREVLRQRAFELRRKAIQLDALANSVPDSFSPEADEALMDLAMSVRAY